MARSSTPSTLRVIGINISDKWTLNYKILKLYNRCTLIIISTYQPHFSNAANLSLEGVQCWMLRRRPQPSSVDQGHAGGSAVRSRSEQRGESLLFSSLLAYCSFCWNPSTRLQRKWVLGALASPPCWSSA